VLVKPNLLNMEELFPVFAVAVEPVIVSATLLFLIVTVPEAGWPTMILLELASVPACDPAEAAPVVKNDPDASDWLLPVFALESEVVTVFAKLSLVMVREGQHFCWGSWQQLPSAKASEAENANAKAITGTIIYIFFIVHTSLPSRLFSACMNG